MSPVIPHFANECLEMLKFGNKEEKPQYCGKHKKSGMVNVKDIAPTISSILEISFPNGCTGNPLVEITN